MKYKPLTLLVLACATGAAFAQQAALTEPQVRAKPWNAKADNPAGKDVEVKIDPKTGAVIGKEKD
jgi:hypothetical protein